MVRDRYGWDRILGDPNRGSGLIDIDKLVYGWYHGGWNQANGHMESPYRHNAPAYKIKKLSPKMKLALRSLMTGAARTNIEAGEIAGLRKEYIAQVKQTPLAQAFMDQQDVMLNKAAANLSGFIRAISAEASVRMVQLMRGAQSESIQFRAARASTSSSRTSARSPVQRSYSSSSTTYNGVASTEP